MSAAGLSVTAWSLSSFSFAHTADSCPPAYPLRLSFSLAAHDDASVNAIYGLFKLKACDSDEDKKTFNSVAFR